MRTIITGIIIFIGWSIFSNYWYTCKIKDLCGKEQAMVTDTLVPAKEAWPKEETGDMEARNDSLEKWIENTIIYFAFDSSLVLNPSVLQEVTTNMNELDPDSVLLEGHTCNIGTNRYNYHLGQRRANRVKRELIANGIEENIISTISHGETQPAVSNIDEEHREKNRRVEFVITCKK
ncbi:MAG: OmpA family protein [Bacteroidales bacterium]